MSYQHRYGTLPQLPVAVPKSLTFLKEDVKDAPLTCSTVIEVKNFDFGFTAGDTFFRSDSLTVHQLTFFHDQGKIEILTSYNGTRRLKMEVKYSSICKLNLCETNNVNESLDDYKLAINIIHPPLFYAERPGNYGKMRFVRTNPVESNYEKRYWETFIRSTAFHLSFGLTTSDMQSFMHQLYENIPCGITCNSMKVSAYDSIRLQDLNELIKKWSWNVQYAVECIKSCGTKGSYFLNYVLYEKKRDQELRKEDEAKKLFAAMYDHLQIDPALNSLEFRENIIEIDRNLGQNFVLVKTMYVTPTRHVATTEASTMDSQGLRYVGIDNLVQIKFRDENLSWFPYELADITITPKCRSGIIIANKLFFEFGGSNSLFRECGTYFCNAKNKREVLNMYQKLGEFEPATAAKLSARLGQYFTSAWKIKMQLPQSRVCIIDDILSVSKDSAGNQYCFTDGNGLMSYRFAKHISRELEIPFVPSTYQIRYPGYKGMLTVVPQNCKNIDGPYYQKLIDSDGPYFAMFRKSQKKFDVIDDGLLDFDIVQWSAPAPFNLYRTFIAILDYLACKDGKEKIVRDRFRELNDCACYNIIEPLINHQAFRNKLEELPTYCPISKMETKNLMNEPFWRSMVEASVVADAKMLVSKTQLPLPYNLGRTAYGVADYTGKLKENQVFFQCSKTLSTKNCMKNATIITGNVGVTRSPIYHPGDIRFLTAVDIPELHHLVDVLVFPIRGNRPIPDEIGGGDLDGDAYSIFWDKALLLDKNAPASDFADDNDSRKARKITLNELQEEHPEFRAEYQKNRNLEPLSNAFLAILLTQDPESEECKKMRKCADIAVNYPKSGNFGRALLEDERQNFWPEFMCKDHEPAYKSSHILCELHEKANVWYQQIRLATKEAEKQRNEMVVKALPKKYAFLKEYFDGFKMEIQKIMTKHQIQTEGELYSNSFSNICGALSNIKLPLINESSGGSIVQKEMHRIFKTYRSRFLDLFSDNWKTDMEEKRDNIFTYKFPRVTAQMIEVAKEMYGMSEEAKSCYAFPWLLWEGLDAWWSTDQEKKRNFSAAKKLETDSKLLANNSRLFKTLSLNPVLKAAIERMNITWLSEFSVLCKDLVLSANLETENYIPFFQNAFIDLLTEMVNEDIPISKSSGEAFLKFLISCMQKKQNENESSDFQKAIQATLIKLAFLPETNIFCRNNSEETIIEQKCIVICVPKKWANEFEEKYELLKDLSGCEDISIGVRRNFKDSVYYSVMSRGSVESGQKLKKMLTPVISLTMQHSMKNTKMHIADEMNNLLNGIFNFQQKFNHSKSVPSQLNSKSSGQSSSQRRKNRRKKAKTAPKNLCN